MEALLGTSIPVYIGVVCIMMGFCAYMTGQALANAWNPVWLLVFYLLLLSFASRFMVFALFPEQLYEGDIYSVSGQIADFIVLLVFGLFSFFVTRSRKMVSQYPWLYERAGLFGWRQRHE